MNYSVLMSVYKNDSPLFLEEALNSVYEQQTRKPDEIVIIFDGPLTTPLYDVLEEFKKNKESIVHYYPQPVNRGLGEALKIGTELCNGDYVFRMDSDDISRPDRFEKQISYLEQHPDIDVLGGVIAEFQNSITESDKRLRICPSTTKDIKTKAKSRNPMNHVTVCFKRNSVLKAGNYQPLAYAEDYYLWVRMLSQGYKLENMNEILVDVRIGNGFENRRKSKKLIDSWHTIQTYMKENKMTSPLSAFLHVTKVRIFVNIPVSVQTFVYSRILRR